MLEALKKEGISQRVIALSMHNDGNYIVKSVKLGVQGYLLKNVDEAELIEAVQAVNDGGGDGKIERCASFSHRSILKIPFERCVLGLFVLALEGVLHLHLLIKLRQLVGRERIAQIAGRLLAPGGIVYSARHEDRID